MVGGMMYFPRMLDKIRLQARGDLAADYQENLGRRRAFDGMCCNFLRVAYPQLQERVLAGGTDEEILEWCFVLGRRLNKGDMIVWNGFISKLGWNDFASDYLLEIKRKHGLMGRDDIATMADLIDLDERRRT